MRIDFTRKRLRFRVVLATILVATTVAARGSLARGDDDAPGIAVGATAPGWELTDQNGDSHTLSALLKNKQVVAIVFHRSADW